MATLRNVAIIPVLATFTAALASGAPGDILLGVEVSGVLADGRRLVQELDRSAGVMVAGSEAAAGDLVKLTGDFDPATQIFQARAEEIIQRRVNDPAWLPAAWAPPLFIDAQRLAHYVGPDITGLKIATNCVGDPSARHLVVPFIENGLYKYLDYGTPDLPVASQSVVSEVCLPAASAPGWYAGDPGDVGGAPPDPGAEMSGFASEGTESTLGLEELLPFVAGVWNVSVGCSVVPVEKPLLQSAFPFAPSLGGRRSR